MMAMKARLMGDENIFQQIVASKDPEEQQSLGRQVTPWDESKWVANREEIVTQGNVEKFTQDPALKAFLLSTGDTMLVEAAPCDKIWGIGLEKEDEKILDERNWKGTNLLGKCLMQVREQIRNSSSGAQPAAAEESEAPRAAPEEESKQE